MGNGIEGLNDVIMLVQENIDKPLLSQLKRNAPIPSQF